MAELQKARMTEIQRTVQRTVATFAVAEGEMEPEGITENSNFGDFKTTFVNSPGISGEFLTDGKFLQYSTMTGVKVMTTEQCLATQLFQAAHLVIELKETIKDLKDRLVIVAVAEREIDKHRAEAARARAEVRNLQNRVRNLGARLDATTKANKSPPFKKSRANPTKTSRKAEREIPVTDMGSSSSTTPMETISTDITPDTGDQ